MPITTELTPITTLIPQTVQANKLHLDRVTIDAAGEVVSASNCPSAEIISRLYAEDEKTADRTYADVTETFRTSNLYAAAANVPAIGTAIMAVFAAMQAWHNYRILRKPEMDKAQALADDEQQTLATAQAAMVAAEDNQVGSEAMAAARTALNDAEAAFQKAQQAAMAARLAWLDPAYPRIGE